MLKIVKNQRNSTSPELLLEEMHKVITSKDEQIGLLRELLEKK